MPSSASCSTPRCSHGSSPSCSDSPRTARRATPRASPTCCACSAPLTTDEVAARSTGDPLPWLESLRDVAPRGRGAHGRGGPLGGGRGRAPAARRARGAGPAGHARRLRGVRGRSPRPTWSRRHARTHGPFTTADVATRLGLGRRRRVPHAAAPGGAGSRRSRASSARPARGRSGATPRCCAGCAGGASRALRKEVEPVEQPALGRFLPDLAARPAPRPPWPTAPVAVGRCAASTGSSPSSTSWPVARSRRARWSRWCCRAGCADYAPAQLDELMSTGEVLWAGHGTLPGTDGWVSPPPRRLRAPHAARPRGYDETPVATTPSWRRWTGAAPSSSARLGDAVTSPTGVEDGPTDQALEAALWDLLWAGRLTNDTLAPLRLLTSGGRGAHRARRPAPRRPDHAARRHPRRPTDAEPHRPPDDAGPLVAAAELEPDATRRAHASAEALLERTAWSPEVPCSAERVAGRLRRRLHGALGVRGLGPVPAWVLRRRAGRRPVRGPRRRRPAADPSPAPRTSSGRRPSRWPRPTPPTPTAPPSPGPTGADSTTGEGGGIAQGARPARSWCSSTATSPSTSSAAARRCSRSPTRREALTAAAARARRRRAPGALGRLTVERADGEPSSAAGPVRDALEAAGFIVTPRGLRLRG